MILKENNLGRIRLLFTVIMVLFLAAVVINWMAAGFLFEKLDAGNIGNWIVCLVSVLGILAVYIHHPQMILDGQILRHYPFYPLKVERRYDLKTLRYINQLSSGTVFLAFPDQKYVSINPAELKFDPKNLLQYLTRYTPEDCKLLKETAQKPRISGVHLRYLFIFLGFLFIMVQSIHWRSWKSLCYSPVFETPSVQAFHPEIQASFIHEDGTLWLVDQPLFQRTYRITRVVGDERKSWINIPLSALIEKGDSPLADSIEDIGLDSQGNPVIILADQILHLQGQTWQRMDIHFSDEQPFSYWFLGEQGAWYLSSSKDVVFKVNLNDGSSTQISFPDDEHRTIRYVFWRDGIIHIRVDEWGVIKFFTQDGKEWQEIFRVTDDGWLKFFTDHQSNIWVMDSDHPDMIGKGSFSAEPEMVWYPLAPHSQYIVDDFVVDQMGRLWMSNDFGRQDVLTVFELIGDTYQPVQVYTSENTNLFENTWIGTTRITSDNRLWLITQDGIYRLDTNQQTLPEPASAAEIKLAKWLNPSLIFGILLVVFLIFELLFPKIMKNDPEIG